MKPSLPRYKTTWDVNKVLHYLKDMDTGTLLALSCKLCMLYLLVSAQRCQTLHVMKLSDMKFLDNKIVINISSVLKQTRPGFHLDPIILNSYTADQNLCIVNTIKNYLQRTRCIRDSETLLISTVKPHKHVSKQTVGRWIKLVMLKAGISDTFKPHSTRAASTSYAFYKGVPLTDIIKSAGWSNAATFAKYYKKPIVSNENTIQMSMLS